MLLNYLKIAFRHLSKNKSYVLINTLGMGVALACCLSAYLLVAFNIEFDNFHSQEKTQNMVKVLAHFEHQNGEPYQNMIAPIVMAPIAADEISGIKRFTRFVGNSAYLTHEEKSFSEFISFADSTFLEMFDFPLKSGSATDFKNQSSIYLSDEMATKFFGDEDALDKTLTLEMRNKVYDVVVAGVFEKIPLNSSFNFNALVRIEKYTDVYEIWPTAWGQWRDANTVFELEDQSQRQRIEEQFAKYVPVRNERKQDATVTRYELLPFDEPITEEEANWSYMNSLIPLLPLLVFITLASIILLIATFNLTNTTIALTVKRLKEIGVRKVVGARRTQVISQFMMEMVITVVLAIVAGVGISQILVPEFATMWGIEYGFEDLSTVNLFLALLLLLFISALLAGLYPALHNSSFQPVSLLKGHTRVKGTNPLTRVLLIGQFALSVMVLVAGVIFTMNSTYQKKLSFGYDMKNVLTVSIQGPEEYNGLSNAIRTNPRIQQVAVTDHHIGRFSYENPVKIDTSEFTTQVYEVGANYFEVMGLPILQGRDFLEDSELDFEKAAIVDQQFVDFNKISNPLGTKIEFQGVRYDVVGVVGNHVENLWQSFGPDVGHFYRMAKPEQYHLLVARVDDPEEVLATIDYVEAKWKETFPGKPFFSRTQEDVVLENARDTNRNLTKIFLFLTVLGCILSATGVYALANLNIEKRTKEIGIRKVLGASIPNILRLINQEFAIIMTIAMLLGGIGGFVLTGALLEQIYSTHIEVGVITVLACGIAVLVVGLSTTSSTILRAAQANPVDTLRDE